MNTSTAMVVWRPPWVSDPFLWARMMQWMFSSWTTRDWTRVTEERYHFGRWVAWR